MKILRKLRIWARRFYHDPGTGGIARIWRDHWKEMMRLDAVAAERRREHREWQLGQDESKRAFTIAMNRAKKRVDALMKYLDEEP